MLMLMADPSQVPTRIATTPNLSPSPVHPCLTVLARLRCRSWRGFRGLGWTAMELKQTAERNEVRLRMRGTIHQRHRFHNRDICSCRRRCLCFYCCCLLGTNHHSCLHHHRDSMCRTIRRPVLLGPENLAAMTACPLAALAVNERAILGADVSHLRRNRQQANLARLASALKCHSVTTPNLTKS
jgi:hypothetical protein